MRATMAVKPTLTEEEMPPLLGLLVLLLVAVAPLAVAPVSVADPLEPPELPLAVGVVELELEFRALAWKAAKVLFSFALTAKTIPSLQ